MEPRAILGPMNPIALVETTAAARTAVLGALATDPVVRTRTGRRARQLPRRLPSDAEVQVHDADVLGRQVVEETPCHAPGG